MQPLFVVKIGIRTAVLERSQLSSGVLEARSEERLGASLFLRPLLRPPPFNTKSFLGALVSQDLNSELSYGICFSSLTWEVSAGRVAGRAVGQLGMPACPGPCAACKEVSGLFQLRVERGSARKTPWPICASSESGRRLRAIRAVLCVQCLESTAVPQSSSAPHRASLQAFQVTKANFSSCF